MLNYICIVDLSCTNNFEVELGSYLRHRSYASRKLKKLAINAAELKLNNQVRCFYRIVKAYSYLSVNKMYFSFKIFLLLHY